MLMIPVMQCVSVEKDKKEDIQSMYYKDNS
jgi:hypothetical protein